MSEYWHSFVKTIIHSLLYPRGQPKNNLVRYDAFGDSVDCDFRGFSNVSNVNETGTFVK